MENDECTKGQINADGEITAKKLWNYEPISATECRICGQDYGCGFVEGGFLGNIIEGELEGGFPLYIKENSKVYKVIEIGDAA